MRCASNATNTNSYDSLIMSAIDPDADLIESTPCPGITFEPGPRSHFFQTPEADRPVPSIEKPNLCQDDLAIEVENGDAANDTPALADRRQYFHTIFAPPDALAVRDTEKAQVAEWTVDPQTNKTMFCFQKGADDDGKPFFTVSQVVAASGIVFRDLPDLSGLDKARRTSKFHFKEKAVLGALILIDQHGGSHVLQTATSANVGPGVDILNGIVTSGKLLWRPIWRKRILNLAPMLKLQLGSIFDAGGLKGDGKSAEKYGRYHSSHVEKKLATFLLYMMLDEYGVRITGKYATCENIRKLNRRIKADPRRIKFEIVISRKWCSVCLAFVKRLSSASGIDLGLRVQPTVEALTTPKGREIKDMEGEKGPTQSGQQGSQARTIATAQDAAFTNEELHAFGDLELEDDCEGQSESEQERRSVTREGTLTAQPCPNVEPNLRYNASACPSEACVPPQNEDGDDLFCPLYDDMQRAASVKIEQETETGRPESGLIALTSEEEEELFGSPAPQTMAIDDNEVQAPLRETEELAMDQQNNRTSGFPSPAPEASTPLPTHPDEGDELFMPLHSDDFHLPVPRASLSPESPREPTADLDTAGTSVTPPPPNATQIAVFARKFAAPFAYQPVAAKTRQRGPSMVLANARERVFQRKPLPATPVTTEPVVLRFGVGDGEHSASPRYQVMEEYGFEDCPDPVFSQLERERFA